MVTHKRDGAVDREDASFTIEVAELAVRVTGKDLPATAAEELEGGSFQDVVSGIDRMAPRRSGRRAFFAVGVPLRSGNKKKNPEKKEECSDLRRMFPSYLDLN